jgi:hypothetical protein
VRSYSIEVDGGVIATIDGVPLDAVLAQAKLARASADQMAPLALDDQSDQNDETIRHDTPLEEVIAATCHEANRQYCRSLGDVSQLAWKDAPGWQRASAIEGVRGIRDGRIKTPADSHNAWMAQKVDDGWVYGPEKSAVAKTHPCLVPYAQLGPDQRRKDLLFFAIATALLTPIALVEA